MNIAVAHCAETTVAEGPLSPAQERLWVLCQFHPLLNSHGPALALQINGPLRYEVLDRALNEILRRHPILSTVFEHREGRLLQRISPETDFSIPVRDLTALTAQDRRTEVSRVVDETLWIPFDLARGPLFRAALLKLGPDDHQFVLALHCTIADSVSCNIVFEELATLYESFAEDGASSLPEPKLRYVDFAKWQRESFHAADQIGHVDYWRRYCAGGLPVLDIATDLQRPAVKTYAGARCPVSVPEGLIRKLRGLGEAENADLSVALLTAFAALLHRYTGQDELAIGIPILNRDCAGAETLLGPVSNQIPLRIDLNGDPSFRMLLSRVEEALRAVHEHRCVPFEKLIEELQPDRDLSRPSLVQTLFQLEDAPPRTRDAAGLTLRRLETDPRVCMVDLALRLQQCGDSVTGGFEYSTDLFKADTMARAQGHWRTLLESAIAHPDIPVSTLDILPETERAQLAQWNRATLRVPCSECVHELFETQAARRPDALAVTFEDKALTYGELNARSNRLAHYMRRRGVGPETLVALCMDRSLEMVIAILGVLKAGGAYLPLDLVYPRERLKTILDDAQCPVILTVAAQRDSLPEAPHAEIICMDETWDAISAESSENPVSGVRPDNIVYVIYTSGSTGAPKGTLLPHSNVVRLLKATDDWFHFDERDVWCLFHSYAFDFSVWELWGALCYGGRLVVVPYLVSRSPAAFYELLEQAKVTVLNQTPSAFRQLMHYEMSLDSLNRRPLALRYVIFGGEALDLASLIPWFEWRGDTCPKLINMYGITETTVHVTYRPLTIDDARAGTGSRIGIAIPHLELHVLDRHLKPTPIGVPGELFVGGDGLARGYLNRPELTDQKFIPHPFSATPGERLYRTGDLVRYTSDGDIEYLGRIDHQVKLRGFRVELGEIESVLAQHPAVREAVALIHEAGPNDQRLVAYVICGEDVADGELRAHIRERLPEYMVPAAFVRLDAFPLTANGKLDRRALPKPEWARRDSDRAYIAPGTETEAALARIWQDVLGVKQVGLHDSFFDLGGHSLLATQVVSRVRDLFHIELSLRVFFESPSLESVAKAIDAEAGREALAAPPIKPVPRDKPLPCSYAEESLWFLEGLSGGFSAYNIPLYLRLRGRLDGSILRRSLLRIVSRHEVLRSRFASSGGRPYQEVLVEGEIAWFEEDLTDLPSDLREMEALRRAEAASQRLFDLGSGPLLRGTLCRLAPDEHILCLVIHHIVFDGWSVGILLRELAAYYEALSGGNEAPLHPLAIQYGDYAAWQREWFSGESLERSLAYWRERLRDPLPVLELPTDHARPAVQTFLGGEVRRRLSVALTERLRTFSQAESVTLFVTLLSCWGILLHRYTGDEDVLTGSAIAGRTRGELEGLIGFFVNTLALRLDLSGEPSFREVLRRTQQVALEAYEHQETPFEALVAALQPERALSRSPLIQVMFVFHNTPAPTVCFDGVEASVEELQNGGAKFDLTFAITDHAEGLRLSLEYNRDLFEASTAERVLDHYETLLEGAISGPESRVYALPFVGPDERKLVIETWNATGRPYPRESSLGVLFAEQALSTPDLVALEFEGARLTYRELNARANRLAHYLRGLGVGAEVLVGLCAERSVEMVVGTLAIIKAGGAYVPLDPEYPAPRLSYMLEDTGAPVVLVQRNLIERLPVSGSRYVCLDDESLYADQSADEPESRAEAASLAYVMYTSGSTGQPKGVCVEHRNVVRLVKNTDYVRLEGEVFLQFAPISFDAATLEIWGPLLNGGRLVVYRPGPTSLEELGSEIERSGITTLWLTSGLFHQMVEHQLEALRGVRQLMSGGDVLSVRHCQRVLESLPETTLINGYGPTECTTFTCCYPMRGVEALGETVSIGRPIANTRVYILDRHMAPVPVGVWGELYVGGDGVARGYLNSGELTAERFVSDVFGEEAGGRLYRTGDVVRWSEDGRIEFLGRMDFQVKLRGFRVELGEIESVLNRHADVGESVVLLREDTPGDKRLVGYVVRRGGRDIDGGALRAFLKEQLPDYMVPSAIVFLKGFPLTANGKVDRRALSAPTRVDLGAGGVVGPRTSVERALAQIWRAVLKVDRLSIHDNFFDLGGHSLLATQVISRVRDSFQLEVPLRKLFESPTIADFALVVEEALLEDVEALTEEQAVRRLSEGTGL